MAPHRAIFTRLFSWNKWLAGLFALQGVSILVASVAREVPITSSYLTLNPIATEAAGAQVLTSAVQTLFSVNLVWIIAIFFFVSAGAHLLAATIYRTRYESELAQGVNRVRWFGYGLSGSLMLVAIALLCGIFDLASLIMIFTFGCVASVLGLTVELLSKTGIPTRLLRWLSGITLIVPWIVFAIYLLSANIYGSASIPGFVYGILGSSLVFFAAFAANFYLQLKMHGKWAQFAYGEQLFMIISFVAQTALAWQIFAGVLRP